MAGAGYYVFARAAAGGGYVTVPNIVGQPITEASYTLMNAELVVGPQEARTSDRVAPYHVISQTPQAGNVVRKGRKVYPVVSKGPDYRTAPSLIGKLQGVALESIESQGFSVGSVATMAYDTTRDTIIGQDPAPGRDVPAGGKIHLLVSRGPSRTTLIMPDLLGRPEREALRLLAPLGVEPVRLQRPDGPFDSILEQRPAPGALVTPGQRVVYELRSSTYTGGLRKREVEYTMPRSWRARAVRVEEVLRDGTRKRWFPRPENLVNGVPPLLSQGETLRVPFTMTDEATMEVYVDEERVRSYYFRGDADPVITDGPGDESGLSPLPQHERLVETEDLPWTSGQ